MEAVYDVYARPSICLCFIYARKIYVRTHGKITRQWKSAYSLQVSPIRSDALLIKPDSFSLDSVAPFWPVERSCRGFVLKIVTQLTKKFICGSLSMSLAHLGTKLFCQRSVFLLVRKRNRQCSRQIEFENFASRGLFEVYSLYNQQTKPFSFSLALEFVLWCHLLYMKLIISFQA